MTIDDNSTKAAQVAIGSKPDPVRRGTNRGVVLVCLVALFAMGGMTWAAVPLYRLFCQVTGYGGTTMRADKAPDTISERKITIRFDANVSPGMPWQFQPAQRTIEVKIGENALAFYKAHNTSPHAVTGSATYNVSPDIVGAYFSKIECFCFTEQTLAAGESVEMPLSFFVDPSIEKDREAMLVKEITLSYTFYPIDGTGAKAEVKTGDTGKGG
ncbi:cytochrome c oxidase assembly protein [Hyphomicrobium sp.]|uniref:cytochrome c oxidase assembly protein n=1 Tax=Hyphomicrobium sp. TaxID=82 RepID=UPI003F6E728C